jgi:hypothetical protein
MIKAILTTVAIAYDPLSTKTVPQYFRFNKQNNLEIAKHNEPRSFQYFEDYYTVNKQVHLVSFQPPR